MITQDLCNLFQTLHGKENLNSKRKVLAETEKELALLEKKPQVGQKDCIDPKKACILVFLPSSHSPTRILMQREDSKIHILEWIFLAHRVKKK